MKGHIRSRGKNTWAIILDVGTSPEGKRKQRWVTVHGKKKDADKELARLLHELNTGNYVEPSKMTLKEYLERWLQDYAKPKVVGTTYERYEEIVRVHLTPALGHLLLSKLQPLDIQSYYSWALQNGRKDGRGGLAAQTVLHHHRVLRQALKHAVRWQLVSRNPADAVEPPRPFRKEMRVLDASQNTQLEEAARGTHLYMPILLALATGMRRGELLAVRWHDVNLEAGKLAVRRALQQTSEGLTFKEPKTSKSRRVIDLPATVVEKLQLHRAEQMRQRELLGTVLQDDDLVCAYPDGKPIQPDNLYTAFKTILRRAGLPEVRLHDLRHGQATMLLQLGVHPKVVSERLGHATIGITLDLYSHVLPSMQEEAAKKLDVALWGSRETTTSAG